MKEARSVVIVLARCESDASASFGIRMERSAEAGWTATWAFQMKESVARREGYESTQIDGIGPLRETYPGCPVCGARSFVVCGDCGRTGCWDPSAAQQTCPWCNVRGTVGGHITSMRAGGDR